MEISSQLVKPSTAGVVLTTRTKDLTFTSIVIIGSDPNQMPDHDLSEDAEVHITFVEAPPESERNVEDLLTRVKQDDCAFFLCADQDAYEVCLRLLGFSNSAAIR